MTRSSWTVVASLLACAAASTIAGRRASAPPAASSRLVGENYRWVGARDGLRYLMNDDEADPAGWLEVLVRLRASLLPALGAIPIARDGTVFSASDGRLTATEFARVDRALRGSGGHSGVHSISLADSGTPAVTENGDTIFLSSKDYHARGWRQENVHYLLHELAHVATDPPDQRGAHTLEFFRVLRVLTRAAEARGKKVYDPEWYDWPVDGNAGVIGAWNGDERWYEVAKKTLGGGGYRWNDRELERGPDWYIPGTGSFVTGAPLSST